MASVRWFESELELDELVLWQGKPSNKAVPKRLRMFGWAAIFVLAVGTIIATSVFPNNRLPNIIFFLIFAGLFWATTNLSPVFGECYAVTDRRLFASLPEEGSFRIVNVLLSQLQSLTVEKEVGHIGTIVFRITECEWIRFRSIDEAMEVYQVIQGAQVLVTERSNNALQPTPMAAFTSASSEGFTGHYRG